MSGDYFEGERVKMVDKMRESRSVAGRQGV